MKIQPQIKTDLSTPGQRRLSVVYHGAGLILISVSLFLILFLTLPPLSGLHLYAITSGSMEPGIPTGSLVCAKSADPAAVSSGEVIVFRAGAASSSVVTHRVVENQSEHSQLITKGDANQAEDREPVAYARFIGKVVAVFPGLGPLALFLSSPSGKFIMLALLAAAALLMFLGDQLKKPTRS